MLRTFSCAIALLSANGQTISDDGALPLTTTSTVTKYSSRFDRENDEVPDLNNAEDEAEKLFRARYAYCQLESNPGVKEVQMHGFLKLKNYFGRSLEITGFMRNMPKPDWDYGVSINENGWYTDSKTCEQTGGVFNPTGAETIGDLTPVRSDATGEADY